MKIGIDARLWGVKHAGIGRYTEELVRNLQRVDNRNQYVVFCRREDVENIPTHSRWVTVVADIPHYTASEQLFLPGIFKKQKLDFLHVPHFNVPIFYNRPFIVTIHDILWHRLQGLGVTNLPAPLYLIKHLGYRLVIRNAVSRARKIIVPSKAVKLDILSQFHVLENKVVVTYEGVASGQLAHPRGSRNWQFNIKKPYLLYVGSLYPHKNVESVVLAIKHLLAQEPNSPIALVIVCGRSVFWERFREFVKSNGAESFVKLIGHVSDDELGTLYKNAEAFVFPTLSEGFGLPGLEAMAAGTPVVCSDIPVLREVYGDAALYFDPKDPQDMSEKIQQVLADSKLRDRLIKAGEGQAVKYSWRKMVEETLKVYKGLTQL